MTLPIVLPSTVVAPAFGVVAYLVHSLWEGALIVALAALVMRAFPRSNATTRYAVWYIALLAVVVIPAVTVGALSFESRSAVPEKVTQTYTAAQVSKAPRAWAPQSAAVRQPPSKAARTPAGTWIARAPQAPPVAFPRRLVMTIPENVSLLIAGLWVLGALVGLLRIVFGYSALAKLQRDALPLPPGYRESMPFWTASSEHGARTTRLCVSPDVAVPVAVGLFDGMILMPDHLLGSFDQADIDRFSVHELAHLQRRDDWTCTVERVACAVLFFNPIMRVISRQLDLEREVACDDWVVERTHQPHSYAVGLTKMAEATPWPHRPVPTPAIFATRKSLSIRVERLLNKHRDARPKLAGGAAAACCAAVLVAAFVVFSVAPVIGGSIASPLVAATPATAHKRIVRATMPSAHAARANAQVAVRKAVASDRGAAASVRVRNASTRRVEDGAASLVPVGALPSASGTAHAIAPAQRSVRIASNRNATVVLAASAGVLDRSSQHLVAIEPDVIALASRASATFPHLSASSRARASMAALAIAYRAKSLATIASSTTLTAIATDGGNGTAHGAFLDSLHAAGYDGLSADEIISLHERGVSSALVLAAGRYFTPRATVNDLLSLTENGVSPKFLDELGRHRVHATPTEIVTYGQHGVSAAFIAEVAHAYPALSAACIVALADHGVRSTLVTGLRERGYDASSDDILELADHGVSLRYIDGVNAHRSTRWPLHDIVTLHDRGVSSDDP